MCKDTCARWSGPGNNEFRAAMAKAFATKQAVRAIIATSSNPALIESGVDASTVRKTFDVRKDWIGEVIEFDGEAYAIRFTKA